MTAQVSFKRNDWVFDTGPWLRPFCVSVEISKYLDILTLIIILITASLSSNTYNKASWRADWTFEGTASMSFITSILLWDLWCLWTSYSGCPDRSETRETFPRTETIRSHSSRASKPSNLSPMSQEMISDSVELWETKVCFMQIQLSGTNVWLPSMHKGPPDVDFESSGSPAKIRVLKQSKSVLLCCSFHMTILFEFARGMYVRHQTT